MKSRRFAIVAVTALAAVGAGAAIAATSGDKGKEVEDAILSDAAERLDVEAGALRSALSEAQLAQIDRAVEDGRLTEEQASRVKEHMQRSGRVLGFPGGPRGHHGPGGPGGPGGPAVFEAIADQLGVPVERLHARLMAGMTLAQVARANGKSIADVKAAAKAAIERQLATDVEDGRLTQEQADEIRADLPEILSRLVKGPRFPGGPGGPPPGGRFGGPPPPGGFGGPPPPRE
jgi:hypothetical protein